MNSRQQQVGMNETLFREINERLEELNKSFSEFTDKIEFVCECGVGTCIERFAMGVAQYETLRSDPTTFAVKPGHELLDVEEVVEEHGHYNVVRKKPGEPAAVAVAEDPRS
jgi:hypothetical protein